MLLAVSCLDNNTAKHLYKCLQAAIAQRAAKRTNRGLKELELKLNYS